MQKIENNNKLYAILHRKEDWKEGLDFLTPDESFCQVGTWWYQKDKHLKTHKHIENQRPNTITQECVIVLTGSMLVSLFDEKNEKFKEITINTGDLMIMISGGHSYDILEDNTKIIECKNGPFISVEKDKIVLE